MEALKSCPFCGGEAALQAQQGNNPAPFAWHVIHHCEGGFMRFGENCGFTKDEAIAAWNLRASPPGGEWRWVLVEPTREMLRAAIPWLIQYKYMQATDRQNAVEQAYRSMIAATPQGDTSSISPITSASKSAPSGSEPSAARDHRNCAVCGKPSKLGDLVGWVLDQDSRLRFCPDCQQTKETGQ